MSRKLFTLLLLLSLYSVSWGKSNYSYLISGGNFGRPITTIKNTNRVFLTIYTDSNTDIRITNHSSYDTTFTLLKGKYIHISLNYQLLTSSYQESEKLSNEALILYSSMLCKIHLSQYINDDNRCTSTRILEKEDCGMEYQPVMPPYLSNPINDTVGNFIKIAAFENNTRIKISTINNSRKGNIIKNIPTLITLNKGQSYTFFAADSLSNGEVVNIINGAKIESIDSCKKIAVFIGNNFGSPPPPIIRKNYLGNEDFFYGYFFEQCIEVEKFSNNYIFIPNQLNKHLLFGKTYKICTNLFTVFSPVKNEIWVNNKHYFLNAGEIINDTLSILTTIKSKKPISAIHLVLSYGNAPHQANDLQNSPKYKNGSVNEITNANPAIFNKELVLVKPPFYGNTLANTLQLLSYKSDSVKINSLWYKLSKKSGDYYYDSIHLKDTLSRIKCKYGCTGYYIFDRINWNGVTPIDSTYGSGVTTIGSIGNVFVQKISINDSPIGWFGIDDTAGIKVCRNAPTKLEINTGIYNVIKANWYLNGKLIDSGGVVTQKFKDTGWHWLKVVAKRNQRQCNDTFTTEISERRIYVYPDINFKLNDTLICQGTTIKITANPPTTGEIYKFTYSAYKLGCDYCSPVVIKPSKKAQLRVVVSKTGCIDFKDTMTILVRDSLKLKPFATDTICYNSVFNPNIKAKGGDTSKYKFSYSIGSQKIIPPFNADSSFTATVILSDDCSLPLDTATFTQIVRKPLKISKPNDTSICINTFIKLPTVCTGGRRQSVSLVWETNGRILADTVHPLSSCTVRGIATDACSKADTVYWNIDVKPKLTVISTTQSEKQLCLGETFTISGTALGGVGTPSWKLNDQNGVIALKNDNVFAYNLTAPGNYSLTTWTQCFDTTNLSFLVKPPLKTKALISGIDTICTNKPFETSISVSNTDSLNLLVRYRLNTSSYFDTILSSKSAILKVNPLNLLSQKLEVIISDRCMIADTLDKMLYAPSSLSILSPKNRFLCIGDTIHLHFKAQGGIGPLSYTISNNSGIINNTNSMTTVSNHGDIYSFSAIDACGTIASKTMQVFVLPNIAPFILSPDSFCQGQELNTPSPKFIQSQLPSQSFSYSWNLDNKKNTDTTNTTLPNWRKATYTLNKLGTNNLIFSLISNENKLCTEQTNAVTVIPNPISNFLAQPLVSAITNPNITFENMSTSATKYIWEMGDGNTLTTKNLAYTFKDTGIFRVNLLAYNSLGCMDSFSRIITINDLFRLFIPNEFSPNGDGINDFFEPIGTAIRSYQLVVFNRWGEQIAKPNINEPWDGTDSFGNLVQVGAYPVQIEVFDKKGYRHIKSQNIIVIR
jgi:gliding motility-associated-like protein